jgi:hypothetical protein
LADHRIILDDSAKAHLQQLLLQSVQQAGQLSQPSGQLHWQHEAALTCGTADDRLVMDKEAMEINDTIANFNMRDSWAKMARWIRTKIKTEPRESAMDPSISQLAMQMEQSCGRGQNPEGASGNGYGDDRIQIATAAGLLLLKMG